MVLNARSRALLFFNTTRSLSDAFTLEEDSLNYSFLVQAGVRETNCIAAGIGPQWLFQHGATSATMLRELGFDAISLSSTAFCNEAVLTYGAANVVDAFVHTAADAVCVCDDDTRRLLGLTIDDLLARCVNQPGEACEILRHATCAQGGALRNVSPTRVVQTGMQPMHFTSLGYTRETLLTQCALSPAQERQIGFHSDSVISPEVVRHLCARSTSEQHVGRRMHIRDASSRPFTWHLDACAHPKYIRDSPVV